MKTPRSILFALALLVACLACSQSAPTTNPPTAKDPADGVTDASIPGQGTAAEPETPAASAGQSPEQPEIDFAQPISTLKSYHLHLEITFRGTHAGQPLETRSLYTQEFIADPPAAFTLIETANGAEQPQTLIFGEAGPATYFQAAADQPCSIRWGEQAAEGVVPIDPATLLPAVMPGASPAGSEAVNGVSATHYTFDQASLADAAQEDTTASGEYWLAEDGGWLVKLKLTIKAGAGYFGVDNLEGEQTYTFEITQANQLLAVTMPGNCQPVLTDVPVLTDAADLVRQPHSVSYASSTAIDQAVAFYEEQMPTGGWQSAATANLEEGAATLFYERTETGEQATVSLQSGANGLDVFVSVLPAANPDGAQTSATSEPGANSTDMLTRLANALNLVLGATDQPSVFASYHAEVSLEIPGSAQKRYSADVQGENIHLIITEGNNIQEIYTIGEQEYIVEAGSVREGMGLVGLAWVMWPLDVVFPYSMATAGPAFVGEENLDGRNAEIYELDSAKADAATLQALQGFSSAVIQQARGNAWIDKETGGLLKLVLDYEVEGQGSGHIEIAFSQIDTVSVELP